MNNWKDILKIIATLAGIIGVVLGGVRFVRGEVHSETEPLVQQLRELTEWRNDQDEQQRHVSERLSEITVQLDSLTDIAMDDTATVSSSFQLHLLSLQCIKTEDWRADEPYLVINANRYWGGPSMDDGDSQDLRGLPPIAFAESISITLFDADTDTFVDRDDNLGTIQIVTTDAGVEKTGIFTRDGAHYVLRYRVR